MTRRLLRGLALAPLLALAAAAPAHAHALLEGTAPERGMALDRAPREVVLRFSEPVETALGAIRVYDADGTEVQTGSPSHPGGRGEEVAIALRDGLPDGGYTVTYRVISADSHPVSGGFTFGVGAGAGEAGSVAELLEGQDSGPVTSVAFAVTRAVQYAAIALAIGVLAVLLLAWLPALRAVAGGSGDWRAASGAYAGRSRRLLVAAGMAGTASAAVALPLQAATATGRTVWSALPDTGDILSTRFGVVWGLGCLAWLLVLALSARRATAPALRPATVGATGAAVPRPGAAVVAVTALAVGLAFLPGLGGHAGVQDPVVVLLPANALHVLSAGAWIGGIAALVLALPAATRRLEPEARTPLLAATVGRFSALALAAVAGLLLGGIVQSVLQLEAWDDLLDTAFGRAVLVKIGLVAVLLGLGAVNRRRTVPRLRRAAAEHAPTGRDGALLRRTLRAELALGVTALAVTGALAGYPPATAQSAGPYSGSADLGPARAELTVDPARPGPNEAHLYLFDRASGRQWDVPKEVHVDAELPGRDIAPIELHARKAGPGHYVIEGAALAPAGEWRLEIAARVTEFDEYRTTFEVPIQ